MYFTFSTYILQGMSFKPNKEDFEEGMKGVVRKLEETMLCIKVNHGNPRTFFKTKTIFNNITDVGSHWFWILSSSPSPGQFCTENRRSSRLR
jgi:hypothetical protein